jgi:hypothetical protein
VLNYGKSLQCLLDIRVSKPQSPSGQKKKEKSLTLPGIEPNPLAVQPTAFTILSQPTWLPYKCNITLVNQLLLGMKETYFSQDIYEYYFNFVGHKKLYEIQGYYKLHAVKI